MRKITLFLIVMMAGALVAQVYNPYPGRLVPNAGSNSVSGTTGQVACFDAITSVGDCTAGTGIVIAAGAISVDRAVIPTKATAAGTPTMAGQLTGEFAVDTSASPDRLYFCGADNGTDCTAVIRIGGYAEMLPLAGGTLTGQLVTDNLGIEFEESDTNPGCAAGNFNIYADTSENKLKACQNGSASDLVGGGSSFDPIATYRFFEDFDAGTLTSGAVGQNNWTVGGGTTTRPAAEAGAPGILRRATSATSGTNALLYTPSSINSGVLPADNFDLTIRLRLNQVDANTTIRAGLNCDNALLSNNPPNNGIYFERLDGDTNWFGVTRATSSSTRTDTLRAASTSWVKLRIRRVNASTIGFTVDASSEVTATLTIPTTGCIYWGVITNSTTADKTVDYDYFYNTIASLTR